MVESVRKKSHYNSVCCAAACMLAAMNDWLSDDPILADVRPCVPPPCVAPVHWMDGTPGGLPPAPFRHNQY